MQRVVERNLLDHKALKSDEGQGSAITQIQRFGLAANLNIRLHCLVLDGVYRSDAQPGSVRPDLAHLPRPTLGRRLWIQCQVRKDLLDHRALKDGGDDLEPPRIWWSGVSGVCASAPHPPKADRGCDV